MPLHIATDLISYLQDMSVDAPNAPDLELATDYLESQGVEITDAVLTSVQTLISLNF